MGSLALPAELSNNDSLGSKLGRCADLFSRRTGSFPTPMEMSQQSWSVLEAPCTKDPKVGTCRTRMAPMYLPDPTVSSTQRFPLCSSPSHALQALSPRLMDKYPGRSFTQEPDAQRSVSETGVCTLGPLRRRGINTEIALGPARFMLVLCGRTPKLAA